MALLKQLTFPKGEAQFRDEFLMPLLRRLGFSIVVNYHGTREFGRDIIFGDIDRFGHVVYFAIQAKYESSISLSGSHTLIEDAVEATNNPFQHPQTGREELISSFYVVNAGDYSDQARTNFFNNVFRRGIRDARLLDGASLVQLDKWAAFNRGMLIRERLFGLLLETRANSNSASSLALGMTAYVEQAAPFPMQRCRLAATEAFLGAPLFNDRLDMGIIEVYWQLAHIVNDIADSMGVSVSAGTFKKDRLQGLLSLVHNSSITATRLEVLSRY